MPATAKHADDAEMGSDCKMFSLSVSCNGKETHYLLTINITTDIRSFLLAITAVMSPCSWLYSGCLNRVRFAH